MSLGISPCGCKGLLPLLLLCALTAKAQTAFVVRITELRSSTYTCTAVMQDGRLRREIAHVEMGHFGHPEIFEGATLEHDLERINSLTADPDFQAASQRANPELKLASTDGRIFGIEVGMGNDHPKIVAFADPYGKAVTPAYLAGFLSFADDVKDRNLPKLKGKVEPVCGPLRHQ